MNPIELLIKFLVLVFAAVMVIGYFEGVKDVKEHPEYVLTK